MFPPQTRSFHNSPALLRLKTLLEKNRASPADAARFRPSPETVAMLERLRVVVGLHKGRALDRGFNPNEPRDSSGKWTSGGDAGPPLASAAPQSSSQPMPPPSWWMPAAQAGTRPPEQQSQLVPVATSPSASANAPSQEEPWWQPIADALNTASRDIDRPLLDVGDFLTGYLFHPSAEQAKAYLNRQEEEAATHKGATASRFAGDTLALGAQLALPLTQEDLIFRGGLKGAEVIEGAAAKIINVVKEGAENLSSKFKPEKSRGVHYVLVDKKLPKLPPGPRSPFALTELLTQGRAEAIKYLLFERMKQFRALKYYTSVKGHAEINSSYGRGKPTETAQLASAGLKSAAQPLPVGKQVYRVATLDEKEIENDEKMLREGRSISQQTHFYSTSIKPPVDGRIGSIEGNVQVRITLGEGVKGLYLGDISHFPEEFELLFPEGTVTQTTRIYKSDHVESDGLGGKGITIYEITLWPEEALEDVR